MGSLCRQRVSSATGKLGRLLEEGAAPSWARKGGEGGSGESQATPPHRDHPSSISEFPNTSLPPSLPGAAQLPTSPLCAGLLGGRGFGCRASWRSLRRDKKASQRQRANPESKFRGKPLLSQTPVIRAGTQQLSALDLRERGPEGCPGNRKVSHRRRVQGQAYGLGAHRRQEQGHPGLPLNKDNGESLPDPETAQGRQTGLK